MKKTVTSTNSFLKWWTFNFCGGRNFLKQENREKCIESAFARLVRLAPRGQHTALARTHKRAARARARLSRSLWVEDVYHFVPR